MGFKDFVKQKLNEDAKKVSSNLIKNVIDIAKEYINTEFECSEDAKLQLINGMKISVEQGPKFVITSEYDESEDKTVQVTINIDITHTKGDNDSETSSSAPETSNTPSSDDDSTPKEGGEESTDAEVPVATPEKK